MATGSPLGPFDGVDLQTLWMRNAMNAGRIRPQLALRIVASACARVHAAHVRKDDAGNSLNLVHGSITLAVVMIGRDGTVQVARVPEELCLQESPEQARGDKPTVASDVFSAGLLLYILLTGDHPFWRDTEEETKALTMGGVAPPPSTVQPGVLPSLDAVVMKAMAPKPADRYPTMRAFQAALEQALEIPGMAATAADLAAWVNELAPPGELPSNFGGSPDAEEAMRLAEQIAKKLQGSDGRELLATSALRELDEVYASPEIVVKTHFAPDGEEPEAASSGDCRALVSKLEAQGFVKLGLKVEVSDRERPAPELVFTAPQHECWACVFFTFDVVPTLYFFTVFVDGTVLLTGAYHRDSHRRPRAVLTGVPNQPPAEVLAAHHKELAALKAKGKTVRAEWGKEARIKATDGYYSNPDTR